MSEAALVQLAGVGVPPPPLLELTVGSTLHGTAVDDGLEDLDIMAVVLEHPGQALGLEPCDTWLQRSKPEGVRSEAGDVDRVVYGLRKFLRLALKSNPTVLLAFFAPLAFLRRYDVRGLELQRLYPQIVSRQAYEPFRGYMRQQHERLLGLRGQRNVTRPELVNRYGYDTKYAGHIVRLGFQGAELLLTGRITLPMPGAERAEVLAVRTGKYTLAEVSHRIQEAETRLDAAHLASRLREEPDREVVERWMVQLYVAAWRAHGLEG